MKGRVAVSRAFGDLVWANREKLPGILAEPEITRHEIAEQDEFLIMGCDGIFERIAAKELCLIVRRKLRHGGTPEVHFYKSKYTPESNQYVTVLESVGGAVGKRGLWTFQWHHSRV